jgi:hypothetical protein
MAPEKVGNKDVLSIWNRMNEKAQRLKRLAEIKYRVGLYVRNLRKAENRITPPRYLRYVRSYAEPLVQSMNWRTCEVSELTGSFIQRN